MKLFGIFFGNEILGLAISVPNLMPGENVSLKCKPNLSSFCRDFEKLQVSEYCLFSSTLLKVKREIAVHLSIFNFQYFCFQPNDWILFQSF